MAIPANTPAKKNDVDSVMRGMLSQVQMAAPKHLDSDRLIRLALTSIKKSKDLMACFQNNPASVLASFMESVQLGLEIDSRGLAYLIPYKGSCTFQVSYKGMMSLAMRSEKLRNIYAEVVYESEKENVHIDLGLYKNLTHKFDFTTERKGKIILAYAVAVFLDGSTTFEYAQPHHIELAKKTAKGAGSEHSPWNTHPEEMWKKTAVKRLCKYLDLSPEIAEAIAKEEEQEIIKPQSQANVIDINQLGNKADMSIYGQPKESVEAEIVAPETAQPDMTQGPTDHEKACIRFDELSQAYPKEMERAMAGRKLENMTADEIHGVCDKVEDESK